MKANPVLIFTACILMCFIGCKSSVKESAIESVKLKLKNELSEVSKIDSFVFPDFVVNDRLVKKVIYGGMNKKEVLACWGKPVYAISYTADPWVVSTWWWGNLGRNSVWVNFYDDSLACSGFVKTDFESFE